VQEKIWLAIILSFFAGYILRAIVGSYRAFMEMSDFISSSADDCLVLIGEVVYKVSFIDQLMFKVLHQVDPEEAKILRNTLSENFEEWKQSTVNNFLEEYPENYKWHLEETDWEGLMRRLTDIYTKGKYDK
jgi:hypothetical protein